jgi:hypothetical protein
MHENLSLILFRVIDGVNSILLHKTCNFDFVGKLYLVLLIFYVLKLVGSPMF